jgi:hypothetical protein
MTELSYERRCDEIVAQTGLLTSTITGADLTVPVPSCPGWNAGQLLRHLGGAQRWATAAEWVVDLTGDAITWRRAHEKAAVAVRAPLTDLLLLIYKRRPARGEGIAVFGDADLLDFWLDRVSFGKWG